MLLVFLPYQWLTGHTLGACPLSRWYSPASELAAVIALYNRPCRLAGLNDDHLFTVFLYLIMFGTFIPVGISQGMHYEVCLMSAYALPRWHCCA